MVDYLRPVRERYQELRDDEEGLERTLASGAEKATRDRGSDAG